MSNPARLLRPALVAWLRADTEVTASFGAATPQVFAKLPRINAPSTSPYIVIAGFSVLGDSAECLDATLVTVQFDVWSLTDPPDYTEAETIAEAVEASLRRIPASTGNSPGFSISGFKVTDLAEEISTLFLTDPSDGKTVHAVIVATFAVDPL